MKSIAVSVAAAFALSACAHTDTLTAGARYVNMGSSFAAGSGTGPGPPGSTQRCGQSSFNYARLLAERHHLALDDVSCGGATSAHIVGPWNELPPQIEAVTRDTRLVTITIGGNDLNLAGNLFAASCEQGEVFNAGGRTLPCTPPRPVAEDAYMQLERNIGEIARQIAARAPQARTVLIEYLTLVPQTQCPNSRLSEEEAASLRVVASRLAEITRRAAEENGAMVLRMDQISTDHTPCNSDPWSVGFPKNADASQGMPWHPNRRGMEVIAERLEMMLRLPGPKTIIAG